MRLVFNWFYGELIMRIRSPLVLLSISTLLAVTGCGGSSSSGGNNLVPDPAPDDPKGVQIQVIGEAIKGVLKNAQVTAYELNAQGDRLGVSVDSARTDANGEYELDLSDNYTGGMIEVEVRSEERRVGEEGTDGWTQ